MAMTSDIVLDAFSRTRENVHAVLDATPQDDLARPPAPGANTVAWLVWHLTRVLDAHLSDAFDRDDVWVAQGWARRLALPFPDAATGFGMSPDDVTQVRASAADLRGYHDAVQEMVAGLLRGLPDEALDRVVDEDWDPPVTLAVRLVSVVDDCAQHVGQAAYARGILARR